MSKVKDILKNTRVIIWLLFILFALIAIRYNPLAEGVAIRSVAHNSSAAIAGVPLPDSNLAPMLKERIISINNIKIKNSEEYNTLVSQLKVNKSVYIETNKGAYNLITKQEYLTILTNETETVNVSEFVTKNITLENGTISTVTDTVTKEITRQKARYEPLPIDIGLKVYDAPTSNIRKGLDLEGGTRVILQPAVPVDADTIDLTIDNLQKRLNIYGLGDIVVQKANDLSGNQYIIVEIAGATEDEVKQLIAQQGKFESKIGDKTVFKGGEGDITYVCRTPQCSGIRECNAISGGGYFCTFQFQISIKPEAAERFAKTTDKLEVVAGEGGSTESYLSEKINLLLDDSLFQSLNIAADLKGKAETEIMISGSGTGATEQEAFKTAYSEMKTLQTVLKTGSLPVKLNIIELSVISPKLGEQFIRNSIFVGLLALLAVSLLVYLRYKKFTVALPISFILASEVIMLLGAASLIGWRLDLAAIAAVMIVIGTGVDHLVIIADETISKESIHVTDWKKKIRNAMIIILGAFFTLFAAMTPLYIAGAGLLRGFAITTIIGGLIGVLIARPAFAVIIEKIFKE